MTELSEIFIADSSPQPTSVRPRAVEPLSAAALIAKLRAVRRKHRFISTAHGAALVLMLALALLLGGMILDWSIGLPIWARGGLLIFDAAALGWLAWRQMILPVHRAPDDGAVALMIEAARPMFQSRLISSIQLARPNGLPGGASHSIARRMIEQTTQLAESIPFGDVVPASRLWKPSLAALSASCVFLGLFLRGQPVSGQLLQRAFLANIPVPYFTEIQVSDLPPIVARGSTVQFKALASRVIPAAGTVLIECPGGQTQKLSLNRTDQKIAGAAMFSHTLADVQDSFNYRIRLNDNLTPAYHVDVQPAPAIADASFLVTYPPYTKRLAEIQSHDALAIVQGSTLHLKITATKKLQGSSLQLIGTDLTIALQRDLNNWAIASADVPLKENATGIAVQLIDTVGLSNADPVVYPLKIIPDRPPTIAIIYPKNKHELATRKAKFLIRFSAGDDFGVDSLSLQYRIDGGPPDALPITINRGSKALLGDYALDISSLPVPAGKADLIGSMIDCWLEARDANDITGPGVSQSQHFDIKCVTEDEKRAQLGQRESEIIGAFGNTAADQQSVTNDVGDMVKDKSKAKP